MSSQRGRGALVGSGWVIGLISLLDYASPWSLVSSSCFRAEGVLGD